MNIFYTEVDKNLQLELNARGKTGFQSRSTNAIDFMVGKVANVEITAYQGSSSISGVVINPQAILGGAQTQTGRYLPSGKNGYLADEYVVQDSIDFYTNIDVATNAASAASGFSKYDPNVIVGNAYLKSTVLQDTSRRTGPYITGVDITIGDHSMGLLNKATINFIIPNVSRDLDDIEEVWFRPGRYVSIDVVHPDSALVSKDTGGVLSEQTLPNKDRIKQLYPGWDVDAFLKQISRMNVFRFEGLITSFDFSYTADGTVEASLSLTGTSNVYTDVSMYLPSSGQKNEKNTAPGTNTENFKIQPIIKTTPSIIGEGTQTTKLELYDVISDRVDAIKRKFQEYSDATKKFTQFLLPFSIDQGYVTATDHFLLVGQQWLPKIQLDQIPEAKNEFKYATSIKNKIIQLSKYDQYIQNEELRKKRATQLGILPEELLTRLQNNTGTTTADQTVNDLEVFKQIVVELTANDLITASETKNFADDINQAQRQKDAEQKRVEQQNVKRQEFIENFNTNQTQANDSRYITLGALIHVINKYIVSNKDTTQVAEIIHSDSACFSNYYPALVSTNPNEILFLPKDPSTFNDMNSYYYSLSI